MNPCVTLSINSLQDFELAREVLRGAGARLPVPLIEILWDNYAWLEPAQLAELLAELGSRVSLHVMRSRFLEVEPAELELYLRHLRAHVDVLEPVAVSDHLCSFKVAGRHVPFPVELEGAHACARAITERVTRYQDALGMQLLLENTAPVLVSAREQIDLLGELGERTGCGTLFDVSNAVVGELNGRGAFDEWLPLLQGRSVRCHVGSYSPDTETPYQLDTHADAVSEATLQALRRLREAASVELTSLTYERDARKDRDGMLQDLAAISACLS